MTTDTAKDKSSGGVVLTMRWSEIVGYVVLILAIAPTVFYTGKLFTRVEHLEQIVVEQKEFAQSQRQTNQRLLEIQTDGAARLKMIERQLTNLRLGNHNPNVGH